MLTQCRASIAVLIIVAMLSSPVAALAEGQGTDYDQYFQKGLDALNHKENKLALRYFILAQILNPSASAPDQYIQQLTESGVRLDPLSREDQLVGYQYYLSQGIAAYNDRNEDRATRCFILAKIFYREGTEPDKYLALMRHPKEAMPSSAPAPAQYGQTGPPGGEQRPIPVQAAPTGVRAYEAPLVKGTMPLQVTRQSPKGPPPVIFLSELAANPAQKSSIRIELGTTLILQGTNIQRFLLTDENFIRVTKLSSLQLQIEALRIGSTFLHVWDNGVRYTIYVQVVFPKPSEKEQAMAQEQIVTTEHARPFRFMYANDWSTYYFGQGTSSPDRQNLDFRQDYGIDGETPYGFLDASISTAKYNGPNKVLTYTVGMSHIPIDGAADFSLRAFDARRFTTPLTLPAVLLRGAAADINMLDDLVGVSLSTGRKISSYGFVAVNGSKRKDFIDAARITLFPKDEDNHYSVNFARSYGKERPQDVAKQVYSIDGVHKIENVTVGGELARDESNTAVVGGLKWERSGFRTGLNGRKINKNYANITGFPPDQGEEGVVWTTDYDSDKLTEQTIVDIYRNLLYFNPDDPDALNYDSAANFRLSLSDTVWIETDAYYVDTPQEISPRRNLGLSSRLAQYFKVWGDRNATVYAGGTYQRSTYKFSPQSEFDRSSILVGLRVPLTSHWASFANYEFSWLHEPFMGGKTNPNVYNAGLSYNRQITDKFSINTQLSFRKENGVKGTNSFLSGQDSAGISVGFAYNPKADISIFGDGGWRRVWAHLPGDQSYNDVDVHLGVRMIFDVFPGIDPRGMVTGFVFKDKNGNKKYDVGEPGIPGVKVKIGDKETVTDADGKYVMSVSAKGVLVQPALESLPAGFIFSTTTFSRLDITQGGTARADFGLTTHTGVYGVVFVDKNGNGVPDSGDQFLGRVKLVLDGTSSEVSDSQGSYFFADVGEGKHNLSIDMASLPMNLLPMVKIKNDISVKDGTTYVFHVPMSLKPGGDSD